MVEWVHDSVMVSLDVFLLPYRVPNVPVMDGCQATIVQVDDGHFLHSLEPL
jgi:hypothetical protein